MVLYRINLDNICKESSLYIAYEIKTNFVFTPFSYFFKHFWEGYDALNGDKNNSEISLAYIKKMQNVLITSERSVDLEYRMAGGRIVLLFERNNEGINSNIFIRNNIPIYR